MFMLTFLLYPYTAGCRANAMLRQLRGMRRFTPATRQFDQVIKQKAVDPRKFME